VKNNNSLFSSFKTSSKAEWLAQITKDLKGRSIDDLDWQLEEHIKLSPVYSGEDIEGAFLNNLTEKTSNSWQIGEYIDAANVGQANANALEGLMGGVNAPLFKLSHLPTVDEFAVLLKEIDPNFISVHFEPQHAGKDPAKLFRNLIYYVRKRGLKLENIEGSMDFDPLLDWTNVPFQPLSRILNFAKNYTPKFKVLQVNGRVFHTRSENTSTELALLIAKGTEYLAKMNEYGVQPKDTNAHLQFSVGISSSYFVEIAKLRALRILWANVLKGYDLKPEQQPPVLAHLVGEELENDSSTNMIRASTQAMSAAIGGADIIFVPPSDQHQNDNGSTGFSRRIARNVQHLLQMESYLDRVVDPASGSYYIETITRALCKQAWKQFQSFEKDGGFMNIQDLVTGK